MFFAAAHPSCTYNRLLRLHGSLCSCQSAQQTADASGAWLCGSHCDWRCIVCCLQSGSYRGLVSLGVGSIGEAPVTGCSSADTTRLGVIVTGMRGGVLMTEELLANGLPVDGISGSLVGGQPSMNPLAVPADPVSVLSCVGSLGCGVLVVEYVRCWGCDAA